MDAGMKAEKLREDERILQAIDKCISSDDLYERNKGILKEILEDVFTTIKGRDKFFRKQYQGFFFVEDYCKSPPVRQTQEFNVNIIIKIPMNSADVQFIRARAGYHQLSWNYNSILSTQWLEYSNFTSGWLVGNENGFLHQTIYVLDKHAFQQAIKNLLAWAVLNIPRIDSYTVGHGRLLIKVCDDGPTFTVCGYTQDFPEMNVNLMPVLEFDCKLPFSSAKEGFKWYAVPESLQDVENQRFLWRLTVYNHENDLLSRHSYLMPVIRQLEKLRNKWEWNAISSYHIKTLAMCYAKSMENDSGFPDTCRLTGIQLFVHMLDRLRDACKTQRLQDFWDSDYNLINVNDSQFADISEQLTRMINEITDDSAKVADWILTPEELIMYQNDLKVAGILQNTDCPSGTRTGHDTTAASGGIELSPSYEADEDRNSRTERAKKLYRNQPRRLDPTSKNGVTSLQLAFPPTASLTPKISFSGSTGPYRGSC